MNFPQSKPHFHGHCSSIRNPQRTRSARAVPPDNVHESALTKAWTAQRLSPLSKCFDKPVFHTDGASQIMHAMDDNSIQGIPENPERDWCYHPHRSRESFCAHGRSCGGRTGVLFARIGITCRIRGRGCVWAGRRSWTGGWPIRREPGGIAASGTGTALHADFRGRGFTLSFE